ncbi:polysaccharide pyruvyl transferase family protein [Epilithonimonas hominis]|uniref:Polysaccharide pyruvyl transferase family protein n=1 Tax=Epilithonimonas hominis TaxID=420404 RepID=A0A3N0X9C2_9FLAO|nr:polysaccharide pyruvyl transferase family protein [Epilithonimonas hominis]ROI12939.1 polysaccharide pyruvyl transferase family protein [Epilithonimonas hominis]
MILLNKIKSDFRRKLNPKKMINSIKILFFPKRFLLVRFMYDPYRLNWGDALNIYLIEKISNKKVLFAYDYFTIFQKEIYSVIGSVLDYCNEKKLVVWGSGFISANSRVEVSPKRILAVRGKLSRKLLIDQNINCEEVYGDPALLLPLYLDCSKTAKKYSYGIIPHYIDLSDRDLLNYCEKNNIKLISVYSSTEDFVKQIHECEIIVSSSLHGLIAAEAYRIPNLWIKTKKSLNKDDDFKFFDYFSSLNLNKQKYELKDAIEHKIIEPICDDNILAKVQNNLLLSCPFVLN